MRASDIDITSPTSFLFKGPPAFGKTLAALSFAIEGPVWLAYWDKKSPVEMITYFTKKLFGDKAKKILDNIEFDCFSSVNANEYLNTLIRMQQDCRYFAIVNDSLTLMTSACVNWSLNFGKTGNPNREVKMKDIIPDFDEYKVETSLVLQCIDLCKALPCHVIWTAHPVSSIKVEGTGTSIRVTKTTPLVTYGSKVGSMVPGSFSEIYHFAQQADWSPGTGNSSKKYICITDSVGEEFAKSPLLTGSGTRELEFTNKLFYEVWKNAVKDSLDRDKPLPTSTPVNTSANPFATSSTSKEQNKWETGS